MINIDDPRRTRGDHPNGHMAPNSSSPRAGATLGVCMVAGGAFWVIFHFLFVDIFHILPTPPFGRLVVVTLTHVISMTLAKKALAPLPGLPTFTFCWVEVRTTVRNNILYMAPVMLMEAQVTMTRPPCMTARAYADQYIALDTRVKAAGVQLGKTAVSHSFLGQFTTQEILAADFKVPITEAEKDDFDIRAFASALANASPDIELPFHPYMVRHHNSTMLARQSSGWTHVSTSRKRFRAGEDDYDMRQRRYQCNRCHRQKGRDTDEFNPPCAKCKKQFSCLDDLMFHETECLKDDRTIPCYANSTIPHPDYLSDAE